jgi:hypothetical protein
MPLINVKLTDEAYAVAQKRIAYARRGLGNLLSTLILADQARIDERMLAQRRQDALSSKQSWRETGVNVD